MAEIEVRKCKSAAELLNQLNPASDDWWNERNELTHCFRGHRNADWPLTAAAFRPFEMCRAIEPFYRKIEQQYPDLGFLEWRRRAIASVFGTFQVFAKEIGIDIGERDLPIAQHYGVPTGLLDWSFSPLIAAHFSAKEGDVGTATHLCVWAMRMSSGQIGNFFIGVSNHHPIEKNPYMRAQRGAFSEITTIQDHNPATEDEPLPSLQEIHAFADEPFLTQFTLPWTEASELRRLLHRYGISSLSLQPSLDRAAAVAIDLGPR